MRVLRRRGGAPNLCLTCGSLCQHSVKRKFFPNVFTKTLQSDILARKFQLKVASRALRTIERVGGLDKYLQHYSTCFLLCPPPSLSFSPPGVLRLLFFLAVRGVCLACFISRPGASGMFFICVFFFVCIFCGGTGHAELDSTIGSQLKRAVERTLRKRATAAEYHERVKQAALAEIAAKNTTL